MKTPKVYIETTLLNFYFAETRGQYYGRTIRLCQDTRRFFKAVEAVEFEPYTSRYVVQELERTRDEGRREEMLKLVEECGAVVLPTNKRAERLADRYIEASAIPARYLDDALHLAISAVHGLDFVVSLNFEHIVKDNAIRQTALINEAEGFQSVGVYTPGEVVDG